MQRTGNFVGTAETPFPSAVRPARTTGQFRRDALDVDDRMPQKHRRQAVREIARQTGIAPLMQLEQKIDFDSQSGSTRFKAHVDSLSIGGAVFCASAILISVAVKVSGRKK